MQADRVLEGCACAGVYFYLYSKLRDTAQAYLQRLGHATNGDIGVGASLVVAFLAGCGNVILTNPIWVVSTRMQVCSAMPCAWHYHSPICTCCQPLEVLSWPALADMPKMRL